MENGSQFITLKTQSSITNTNQTYSRKVFYASANLANIACQTLSSEYVSLAIDN